jgi:hypothetical protein
MSGRQTRIAFVSATTNDTAFQSHLQVLDLIADSLPHAKIISSARKRLSRHRLRFEQSRRTTAIRLRRSMGPHMNRN